MRKVLIVAPYCSLPGEPYFNRFLYLADLLSADFDVTLLTSSFRHFDKTQRVSSPLNERFKVVVLNEPGYKRNVGVQRIYSHYLFCKRFASWFSSNCDYDVVYSAFPLIETNRIVLGKGGRSYKVIVDVQDVWPESISSVFPIIQLLPRFLIPFARKADRVYRRADAIVAVSETYLKRALIGGKKRSECVYIGSDFDLIRSVPGVELSGGVVRMFYIGTVSHSYDLETVVEAVKLLADEGVKVEFNIFGGGPDLPRLKVVAGGHGSILFHGFIGYEEMISYVKSMDIAINPIHGYAAQTVTNKLSDYLSLGKPILSSQKGGEVNGLLKRVVSFEYESGDVDSFVRSFKRLMELDRSKWNSAPLAVFDRKQSYKRIVSLVGEI